MGQKNHRSKTQQITPTKKPNIGEEISTDTLPNEFKAVAIENMETESLLDNNNIRTPSALWPIKIPFPLKESNFISFTNE